MTLKKSALAIFSALLFLFAISATDARSQTLPSANGAATPAALPEKDPYGRETPQAMVSGLMNALAAADYERAVQYFETESVPGLKAWYVLSGQELARRFQELLDRAGNVTTPAELSNNADGNVNDSLAPEMERFGVVKTPTADVPLLATRVTRDGKLLWRVSGDTLRGIPAMAASLESGSSISHWLGLLPEGPIVGGAPLSHWLVLITAAGFSFAFAWTLTALRRPLARLIRRGGPETKLSRFIEASAGPLRVLITLVSLSIIMETLGITVVARYRALFVIQLVSWFALSWLLWRWADAAGEVILGQMSRRGQLTAYSAVSFLSRAFKAVIFALLLAALLRAFGVNVTAGLAALGVGGLAIALGAQKLFENLIGSLTLIADRPIRIGDFCNVSGTLGTVEEIGIRSTRIRTLDRTVLTVPNGELSSLKIENFSERDRFWFHPILNLRYETSPDQMRHVLNALRAMLTEHPKVDDATMRVRLVALGAHSLDIEVFAYVMVWDFVGFLEVQEELLLKCMEVVEAAGTGFAFPSQTLYLGRDTGLDESRTRDAEAATRSLRAKEK